MAKAKRGKLAGAPVAEVDTRLSAANQAPVRGKPRQPVRKPVPAVGGTLESDLAVGLLYPTLGDMVMVDVDRVEYMQQNEHHHALRRAGLHGKRGQVVGAEVRGGVYMLKVETGVDAVYVDARCVTLAEPQEQPRMMQDESRKSPERMRKQKPGSYNMT